MRKKLYLFGITMVFAMSLLAGLKTASALDTVVVGQPYAYPYYGGYGYGPYAPIAYPGLYSNNPAIQPGSYPASPFFLGNQVRRATGANVDNAFRATGFINYAPVPGDGVYGY